MSQNFSIIFFYRYKVLQNHYFSRFKLTFSTNSNYLEFKTPFYFSWSVYMLGVWDARISSRKPWSISRSSSKSSSGNTNVSEPFRLPDIRNSILPGRNGFRFSYTPGTERRGTTLSSPSWGPNLFPAPAPTSSGSGKSTGWRVGGV